MRSLARHGWIRCATIFLLAWISVDLGLPDLCAGDVFDGGAPTSSLSHNDAQGQEHAGLLHPDHCFCHGHSITLSVHVLTTEPARYSSIDPFCLGFVPCRPPLVSTCRRIRLT
jgi:hypothetical protein